MLDLLKARRSIRKYKEEKVDNKTIDKLLEAMLLAPTGKNARPFEFIVVDDREILNELSVSKANGAQFLKTTPQCIVVLSDSSKTNIWIEDGSIALTIGHLFAHELGLGSCWIQIRERERKDGSSSELFVKDLFNLPEHIRVIGLLAFGYPDEEKTPKTANWDGKVFYNKY